MAEINPSNPCFGCGGANSRGMQLAFDHDDERLRIVGRFRLGSEYQGGAGFIHGGIIATVLDEAMGKVCRFSDVRAVTAELSIEYLRPIRVDEEIIVEAFQSHRDGRQLFHQGEVRNSEGQLLAGTLRDYRPGTIQ
ncbi:MAG: PaaI family thioesterase [Acidobacteria bacterium]|nr:MAG: PaaI family thioesterase [Acidobacteriota bacterium]